MKLKKMHWVGIVFGLLVIIGGVILLIAKAQENLAFFLFGIGVAIVCLPFFVELITENKKEQMINEMFLEFSRNLSESVNTGTPVSKSIINMSKKNYGVLNPYIEKLANQISLGIPVNLALENFAREVNNPVITRSIELISEAERAGGEIEYILESVSKSISEVEKLRKERKAAISSLVVQGYIIFLIFIGIMLIMEYKILPITMEIGNFGNIASSPEGVLSGEGSVAEAGVSKSEDIGRLFLYLLLTQGFFTGLIIGKLSEGLIRLGIKHSFILMITSFLVYSVVHLLMPLGTSNIS